MRLLVQLNYDRFLLPPGCDAAAFLETISGAVRVDEKQPDCSKPACYAPSGAAVNVKAEFIAESQIISEDDAAEIHIKKLQTENMRLYKEKAEVGAKLAELEAKVAALTAVEDA